MWKKLFILILSLVVCTSCGEPVNEEDHTSPAENDPSSASLSTDTTYQSGNAYEAEQVSDTDVSTDFTNGTTDTEERIESTVVSPPIYHIQDAAPIVYRSLDDMLADLTDGSMKHAENSNFELFGLDQVQSLYIPAFERDDYRLHFVEMKGDSAKYYYVPSECDAQTADLYLNSISIIVTIVDLKQHPSSTPEGMVASGRFEWKEEGYAYSQVYRQVAFAVENAGIVIRVPDHMNDYNTIRSLCKVQRTIIDPTHVTE